MRISDLLLEAGPTSYVPASPGSPIVVPTPLTPPTAPAPSPTAPPPAPSGPDPDKRAERQNKVERGRRIQKKKNSLIDLIQNRRNEPAYNELGRKNALKRIGGGLRILRLMGYSKLAIDYWTDISIMEEELARQVAAEETTRAQADAEFKETRKELLSTMATIIAGSSFIKYAIRSAFGLRYLMRGLAVAGGAITGGVSIALLLASEVAMTYFLGWASSAEGQKTIAEYITYPWIGDLGPDDVIGMLVVWPIDKIKSIFSGVADKITKQDTKPGQAGQATTPGKPGPDEKWKPGQDSTPATPAGVTKPGTYSQYATDPELKKALTAAGL
jgi:hypothetical protein